MNEFLLFALSIATSYTVMRNYHARYSLTVFVVGNCKSGSIYVHIRNIDFLRIS